MDSFNTSLLQEKFVITDKEESGFYKPMVIASNRMSFTIGSKAVHEDVVIRTKNSYIAVLIAFKILNDFFENGLFLSRAKKFDWARLWAGTISLYDAKYNNDLWGVVYINGEAVLKIKPPRFIDVIEQCALLTKSNYENLPFTLETMIKKAGKDNKVDYKCRVGATIQDRGDEISCGVLYNTDEGNNSFVFDFAGECGKQEKLLQSVMMCAAHLEASWIDSFARRSNLVDIKAKRQVNEAILRKYNVQKFIKRLEEKYKVTYFPFKPDY